MPKNHGKPLAQHVQAAIDAGRGVGAQAKRAGSRGGREMADHVREAVARAAQREPAGSAQGHRPVPGQLPAHEPRVVAAPAPGTRDASTAQPWTLFGYRITGGSVDVQPHYTDAGGGVLVGGGQKSARILLRAGFWNLWPFRYASCCEIRHMISWSAHANAAPTHAGFGGVAATPGVWHEDRDPVGRRFGHRANIATHVDYYYDSNNPGVADQANGNRYYGEDIPVRRVQANMGRWYFRLDVIDTCNNNIVLASSPVLTIDWDANAIG